MAKEAIRPHQVQAMGAPLPIFTLEKQHLALGAMQGQDPLTHVCNDAHLKNNVGAAGIAIIYTWPLVEQPLSSKVVLT